MDDEGEWQVLSSRRFKRRVGRGKWLHVKGGQYWASFHHATVFSGEDPCHDVSSPADAQRTIEAWWAGYKYGRRET